jgi:hypothetical protein
MWAPPTLDRTIDQRLYSGEAAVEDMRNSGVAFICNIS